MPIYIQDVLEMAWPALIDSWFVICTQTGITTQATHLIYTPGRIQEDAVSHALDAVGIGDVYNEVQVALDRDLAEKALVELMACFYWLLLTEFEGAAHVKRKMTNYTNVTVDESRYPADFERAINTITCIEGDLLHRIIIDASTAAAKTELCTWQAAYHWSLVRLMVKLRPYALHWLEEYAKRISAPGGIDHQEGLTYLSLVHLRVKG